MAALTKYPEPLVFGLDIGTRSIVGTVGYRERDKFNVIAMAEKLHETRSMIDGQIHDIAKVSEDIRHVKEELESQLDGRKLHDVCIAAAGRVLKTAIGRGEYEFSENTVITQEHIYSIDLIGVEKAHNHILEELGENKETTKYYCVGYSVVKYYLNDYEILNLEGHKGTKIGADVLATFLPEEVVNSLYTAVEMAGLYVANLTLEPIAAMNVAIPEHYRLLNIALVDVGAGTSDICITRDGSIIGYGMIPSAGDEMTEALIKKYLVDFNTAEKLKTVNPKRKSITYKDIMGISHKLSADEILQTMDEVGTDITGKIAQKIKSLNSGVSVSAVFVVGGGGKIKGFTDKLADALDIPRERVAVRGQEVMNDINFLIDNIKKDSLYVTPIGICLNFFDQKNNFIFVTVNEERIKLYNNDRLTVLDAAMQYGLSNEDIFPKRGPDITFKINGKSRIVRGYNGEAAFITQNGKTVGLNAPIEANDRIMIKPSTAGEGASIELGSIPEYNGTLSFIVNDIRISCPKFAIVNGNPESQFYNICDGDDICMQSYYTLEQLLTFMDVKPTGTVFINNNRASTDDKVYDNFVVSWVDDILYADIKDDADYIADAVLKDDVDDIDISHIDSNSDSIEGVASNHSSDTAKSNDEENADALLQQADKPITNDVNIVVNGQTVTLKGKEKYIFVDVFDFYEFDLSTVRGSRLVTNINNHHAEFTEPLLNGYVVDIFWEK